MKELNKAFKMTYANVGSEKEYDELMLKKAEVRMRLQEQREIWDASLIDVTEIRDGKGRLAGYFLPDVYDLTLYPEFTLNPVRVTRKHVLTQKFDGRIPINGHIDRRCSVWIKSEDYARTGAQLFDRPDHFVDSSCSLTVGISVNPGGISPFYSNRNGTYKNINYEGRSISIPVTNEDLRDWNSNTKHETLLLKFDDRTHRCINDNRIELHMINRVQRKLYGDPNVNDGFGYGRFL